MPRAHVENIAICAVQVAPTGHLQQDSIDNRQLAPLLSAIVTIMGAVVGPPDFDVLVAHLLYQACKRGAVDSVRLARFSARLEDDDPTVIAEQVSNSEIEAAIAAIPARSAAELVAKVLVAAEWFDPSDMENSLIEDAARLIEDDMAQTRAANLAGLLRQLALVVAVRKGSDILTSIVKSISDTVFELLRLHRPRAELS
jgi:hypothetical protein